MSVRIEHTTITVYNYHCGICNKDVYRSPIPGNTCSKCHTVHCRSCHGKYFICKPCFSNMTPEEKLQAKQEYIKVVKQTSALFIGLFALIFMFFVIPVIFFRNNEALFYTCMVISPILLFFTIIEGINYARKKKDPTAPSIWKELATAFKNRPKVDKDSKKKMKIVIIIFIAALAFIIIVAAVIMADFNSRWE